MENFPLQGGRTILYQPRTGNYVLTISADRKAISISMNVMIPQQISFQWRTNSDTPSASLGLEIKGADGTTFNSGSIVGGAFSGKLPASQDYFITVKAGVKGVTHKLVVVVK